MCVCLIAFHAFSFEYLCVISKRISSTELCCEMNEMCIKKTVDINLCAHGGALHYMCHLYMRVICAFCSSVEFVKYEINYDFDMILLLKILFRGVSFA